MLQLSALIMLKLEHEIGDPREVRIRNKFREGKRDEVRECRQIRLNVSILIAT